MSPSLPALADLAAETSAMRALLTLLKREQASLAAADADTCAALLDDKSTQIGRLSTLAAQRHHQLGALGWAADEYGMRDWLRTATADIQAAWDVLMAVARDAQECNRVNGLLLTQLAACNRQALEAMGLRAGGSGLYGSAGQADYAAPRAAHFIG